MLRPGEVSGQKEKRGAAEGEDVSGQKERTSEQEKTSMGRRGGQ